jgi:diguanylate cyclase (GGDEF)-like protein/putative nucleotidyltransferase with HDIG domain
MMAAAAAAARTSSSFNGAPGVSMSDRPRHDTGWRPFPLVEALKNRPPHAELTSVGLPLRARPPVAAATVAALAAAFVALHLAGAFWGRQFAVTASGATTWYPSAGLGVALLVAFGWRLVGLVLVASLVTDLVVFSYDLSVTGIAQAAAVTGAYAVAIGALGRLGVRGPLRTQRELGLFVAIAVVVAPLLAAVIGVAGLVLWSGLPAGAFWMSVRAWFVGDALGVVTVAPVALVVWAASPLSRRIALPSRAASLEGLVILAVAITAPFLALRSGPDQSYVFAALLPIAFIAVRHGVAGAAFGVLATNAAVAVAAAHVDLGSAAFLRVQAFMGAAAVTGLYLGVVVEERRAVEARLRAHADEEAVARRVTAAAAAGVTTGELIALVTAEAGRLARRDGVSVVPVGDALPAASTRVAVEVGGTPWGAIAVPGSLDATVGGRLTRLAEVLGAALENAEARAVLSERAATDPLTGLTNHRTFHERLQEEFARARRHGRDLSVVLFDLDGFKDVNAVAGHQGGDALLREVAVRLTARLRAGNILARIGGDEFALIVPEGEGIEAVAVAERLRRAIVEEPFADGRRVAVSAGVCDRKFAETAADLVRLADGALYWAKVNGRDRVWLYSPEIAAELSASERADHLARTQALAGIRALARAIDAKDPSTREHSERVATLSVQLARAVGWDGDRLDLLEEAALVHDVGKIGVPDAVLLKPGRLTDVEYEAIKLHAALGAQIAAEVLRPEQVRWIRSHHERLDGRGYPDALTRGNIPDGSLIIALADSWDVMTSARPYSEPMTPSAALIECRRCAGTQFEPALVDALEGVVGATHAVDPAA